MIFRLTNFFRLTRSKVALLLLAAIGSATVPTLSQTPDTASSNPLTASAIAAADTIYSPTIIYSPMPDSYEIAGIKVSGIKGIDDYVIIGYSGLSVGERIEIPGDAITQAVKRFWKQGLYSKV